MEPQNIDQAKNSLLPTVAGVLVAVVVLSVPALYYFNRPLFSFVLGTIMGGDIELAEDRAAAWKPVSSIESGDFKTAVEQAQAFISEKGANGGVSADIAQSALEVGMFYNESFESRIEAIRLTKASFYEHEGDSLSQALKVNKLLSFIQIAMDPRINKEIFSGESFANLWVPKDLSSSIKNLAEFSLSLHSTNTAYFHTAVWYADRIRNLYGAWGATPEEKKRYADEIIKILGVVDEVFAENAEEMSGRVFGYTERFHTIYSKVFFNSVVARVYPEYLQQTKESLAELEVEYAATRRAAGGVNAFTASRMPDAYFAYAGALAQTKGKEAYNEIAATLDKLIEFVESDPKPHEGFYLAYIRMDRSGWTEARRQRALRAYYDLAAIYPPFKQFLERNGWTFN